MNLTRWFALIGIVTVLGVAKVAQQTAIWLTAYQLGRTTTSLHQLDTETQWLTTKLVAIKSPAQLAAVMETRRLPFVAWSEIPTRPPFTQMAKAASPLTAEPTRSHGQDDQ